MTVLFPPDEDLEDKKEKKDKSNNDKKNKDQNPTFGSAEEIFDLEETNKVPIIKNLEEIPEESKFEDVSELDSIAGLKAVPDRDKEFQPPKIGDDIKAN